MTQLTQMTLREMQQAIKQLSAEEQLSLLNGFGGHCPPYELRTLRTL